MGAGSSKDDDTPQPTKDQGKLKPPLPMNDNEAGEIRVDRLNLDPATGAKLPHNLDEILKDADDHAVVHRTSTEKLHDQLYRGVFLNQRKKKYWVDRNSKNCFMLYAKDLSITWAEENSYWHWPLIQESSSNLTVVAAELLNVCWLEVHGRFNTINLTPRTLYEVVFVVMLKDPAYGWEVPINLRIILANGSRKEHKENMMEKNRGKWIEIPAGEFETSPDNIGEMEISLYEYDGGIWKKGLLIKGVLIRPKHTH